MSTISASTTSTTAYKVTADTTGTLVLQTGATPTTAMVANGNQYLTIGATAVDGYPLYINKNSNSSTDAMLYMNPSTGTNSTHILMNNSGTGTFIIGRANSAGTIQTFTGVTAYASVVATTSTLPIHFATNNTNAMNINSGQYVCVSNAGTTANYPLSVLTPSYSAAAPMAELNPSTSTNASVLYINNAGAGSLYIGRASSAGTGAPASMNAAESFMMHSGNQRLVLGSNSLRALLIDSSGYVTTPYQPSFCAYSASSQTGAKTPVVFDTVRHNIGGGYSTSTGRFTAPVDGVYFFSVTNNVINSNGVDGLLRKNGGNIIGTEFDTAGASTWLGLTATTVLQLSAGDYVDYIIGAGSGTTVEGVPWNNFVGFLIG